MPTKGSAINLTAAEQRYCRCLTHVASQGKTRNPYAICTSSVFSKQGHKRGRIPPCSENYNFSKMKTKDLVGYAKLHKISYSGLSDEQLARKLNSYVTSKYGSRRGSGVGVSKSERASATKKGAAPVQITMTKRKFDEATEMLSRGDISHKNVWLEYVKSYRKDHPTLTYKQALTNASREYKSVKY